MEVRANESLTSANQKETSGTQHASQGGDNQQTFSQVLASTASGAGASGGGNAENISSVNSVGGTYLPAPTVTTISPAPSLALAPGSNSSGDAVSGIWNPSVNPAPISGTTAQPTGSTQQTAANSAADYHTSVLNELGGSGSAQVNEEQLYGAIIAQQLTKNNPAAGAYYKTETGKFKVSMAPWYGPYSDEVASQAALKSTALAGLVDVATAERINGIAFAAAQLDGNKDALYDSIGSGDTPTMATATLDQALASSQAMVALMESGQTPVTPRSLDAPSNWSGGIHGAGTMSKGEEVEEEEEPEEIEESEEEEDEVEEVEEEVEPEEAEGLPAELNQLVAEFKSLLAQLQGLAEFEGFYWQPVSDKSGKLAVMLPKELAGQVDRVEIHSAVPPTEESKLTQGKADGVDPITGQPIFRFDKTGAEYGQNLHLVVYKSSGEPITWAIPDGSQVQDPAQQVMDALGSGLAPVAVQAETEVAPKTASSAYQNAPTGEAVKEAKSIAA